MMPKRNQEIEIEKSHLDSLLTFHQALTTNCSDFLGTLLESDIISAEALHRAGQEPHTLFFLQQAIEKTLKALVLKQTRAVPPRIHNLPNLAGRCELELTREHAHLLRRLDRSYTKWRYPESWGDEALEVSGTETDRLLSQTKEFLTWLRQKL